MKHEDMMKMQEIKVKFHAAKMKFRIKIKVKFHVTFKVKFHVAIRGNFVSLSRWNFRARFDEDRGVFPFSKEVPVLVQIQKRAVGPDHSHEHLGSMIDSV